jgi:hypothetical protein
MEILFHPEEYRTCWNFTRLTPYYCGSGPPLPYSMSIGQGSYRKQWLLLVIYSLTGLLKADPPTSLRAPPHASKIQDVRTNKHAGRVTGGVWSQADGGAEACKQPG